MSFGEAQRLLLLMNVEMDQDYALSLFQVRLLGGFHLLNPYRILYYRNKLSGTGVGNNAGSPVLLDES